MAGIKPLYYWDSCVFIAWLTEDPTYEEYLPGMEEYTSQIDRNEITLVTSTIVRSEVLPDKMPGNTKRNLSTPVRHSWESIREQSPV